MPKPNNRHMRQAKRPEKHLPFCCWLSFIMKKLKPKSMAKMPYILPERSQASTSATVWSDGNGCTISSYVKMLKCSTE